MKKVIVTFLALLLVFTLPAAAFKVDVKGDVEQDVAYDNDSENFLGHTKLDLELSKDFGFDKMLYLNPVFEYFYDEDTDFDDLELEKDLKEGYFDFYLDEADIRIGKQIVNWGTAYELNPTDVVNPLDLTAADPLDAEMAVPAIKGTYYYDYNTEITGVMITDYIASPLPAAVMTLADGIKQEFVTGMVKGMLEKGLSQEQVNTTFNKFSINEPVEPDVDSLEDAEYALQFTRRNVNGYDISVSYFNGYEDLPSITSDLDAVKKDLSDIATEIYATGSSSKSTSIDFGYKKTQAIGFNVIGAVSDFGVWSETNYSFNEDDEKAIDTVLGADYTFKNNFYAVAQYLHRQYNDYIIERDNMDALILHGQMPFRQIHEWSADLVYDVNNEDLLLNPEVEFSLGDGLKLNLGTVITKEDDEKSDGLLNMLASEKTYLKLTYSF